MSAARPPRKRSAGGAGGAAEASADRRPTAAKAAAPTRARPPRHISAEAGRALSGGREPHAEPHRDSDQPPVPPPALPYLRSPEYNDVIGAPPPLAVRSGLLIAAILLTCLAIVAAILPYPAVIAAPVQLVSTAFPQQMVAQASGPLLLLPDAVDGHAVRQSEMLALIDGDGAAAAKLQLLSWLATVPTALSITSNPPPLPALNPALLGSVGPAYVNVAQAMADWSAVKTNVAIQAALQTLQQQQAVYDQIQALVARKQASAKTALLASQRLMQYRNQLVADGLVTKAYVDQYAAQDQAQADLATDARLSAASNTLDRLDARRQADALSVAWSDKQLAAVGQLAASLNALRTIMGAWTQDHILRAPGNGYLRLFGFWSDHQQIQSGDVFATIDPPSVTVSGFAFVPAMGFGEVHTGQRVVIHLDAFPQARYGFIEARVAALSQITQAGKYRVLLSLPGGLASSHHLAIGFSQNMTGTADIMVQPMSLLHHLLYGLAELFSRQS